MINFLIKRFVKDYESVKDRQVRHRYGIFSGVVGILCNLILFTAKFLAGTLTGSIAIAADAINNLSDAGSSIVTLLGFQLANRPADPKHPFGHGRMEYLAGLAVSAAILYMGIDLLRDSISRILHPEAVAFSKLSVAILLASIALKLWMYLFNHTIAKRISSPVMAATAIDSLSDCIATGAVLLSLIISTLSGLKIDGYAGALVAIFIIRSGLSAGKETLQPLLGKPADAEFVRELTDLILSHKEILGIHDIIAHDYGPGRVFVTLHAELSSEMNILDAHELIDTIEAEIAAAYHCLITIHMDPIVTNDAETNERKEAVAALLKQIDPSLSLHDFRLVKGTKNSNLIFDVLVPFTCPLTNAALSETIQKCMQEQLPNCTPVMHFDRDYVEKEG